MLCNAFNDTFESDCGTLNEFNWINDYVGVIDACLSFDACRLTGQLGSCQCSSNCHFGQTSIPSRMTPPQALTIWYTNQVCQLILFFTLSTVKKHKLLIMMHVYMCTCTCVHVCMFSCTY